MAIRFGRLLVYWPLAATAFATLFLLDLVDIGLYVGNALARHTHAGGWISAPVFDMSREFSLVECLEYAKSAVAACAALICGRLSGQRIFYALAGVNVWLAVDNAFELHERAGLVIGDAGLAGHNPIFNRPQDAGELIYLLVFGLVVFLLLAWALRRTEPKVLPTGLLLVAAVMSPGLTGVFADAFHGMTVSQHFRMASLVIVEDGGETIMLSVCCALTLGCLGYFSRQRLPAIQTEVQQA